MIITRYHNKVEMKLTVEFLTPTFLGGADQNAELRTAPFKNLLRQWWRIAEGYRFADWEVMLHAENSLFGSVLDDRNASASEIRLALNAGDSDVQIVSDPLELGKTPHPEVKGGNLISNALYLGFGPITYSRGTTAIKKYIRQGSKATLSVTLPRDRQETFSGIFQLIDTFGAIGSRSRNGWGSLALSGEVFKQAKPQTFPTRPFAELIEGVKAYPSALGVDKEQLLCWETDHLTNWKECMQILANSYLLTRTAINISPEGLQQRHALGYPVTNHFIPKWGGGNGRMPSQLRLMVKRNQDNKIVGRILHLPHKLPKPWDVRKLGTEMAVWQKVHELLDKDARFHRCGGAR